VRARKVVWVSLRYVVSAGEVSRRTAEREEEEHVVVEDGSVLTMSLRWWLPERVLACVRGGVQACVLWNSTRVLLTGSYTGGGTFDGKESGAVSQ
jgi:hypothetical protein